MDMKTIDKASRVRVRVRVRVREVRPCATTIYTIYIPNNMHTQVRFP